MANSIQNNKRFRAMLMRKTGASGAELQAETGRAYTYSLWSLRCMTTETHSLITMRDATANCMRYYLMTDEEYAAFVAKHEAKDAVKLENETKKAKAPVDARQKKPAAKQKKAKTTRTNDNDAIKQTDTITA